jgi:predicted DNA-binding transcriptional regulator YafY
MPKRKSLLARPERIAELVQLLAGRRPIPIREIAERYGISVRTAYRDLERLGDRWPITSEDGGYRILETARLLPLQLTAEERAVLELALDNPSIRRRRKLALPLRSLEAKLHRAQHAPQAVAPALTLSSIDRTGAAADGVLAALERAISERRVCDAIYVSLSNGESRRRRLRPLRLFLRSGAWYLAAFAPEHDEVRTFRLDRFDDVRLREERFTPHLFDLDDYLADTWEIFRGDGEFEVHLRFDAELGPLLLRGRQHDKESVESCADGIHYRVEVTHLDELARWIVGFGGEAVVVGPEELSRKVVEIAKGAVSANDGRAPGQGNGRALPAAQSKEIGKRRTARK